MRILIFGASGATGLELVKKALEQEHDVTAFVRDLSKLPLAHNNLRVIQGDVKDYKAVEQGIKDQDAVLSALGASSPFKRDPILITGVKNIIRSMQELNVKRFIYLSFIGVSESRKDAGFVINHILAPLLHAAVADHEEKENLIKASNLEWTIVRPPKLTNGSPKGIYRSGEDIKPKSLIPTLSRADLADFLLKQVFDKTFLRKAPRVMY